jgi:hypothetical protein
MWACAHKQTGRGPRVISEVETVANIAEEMMFMWLMGELPSLDELKEWGTALHNAAAEMEDIVEEPESGE